MNITFIFSPQYEHVIARTPVSVQRGQEALQMIEKLWQEHREKIGSAFKKIMGLEFKDGDVNCYINSRASFSDPLSLKIDDPRTMLDNLTHELIHVILTHNYDRIGDKIRAFHKEYEAEPFVTRVHILIHAIHFLVAQEIFPDRVQEIRGYSKSPEYLKSWQIADDKGPECIVRSALL